MSKSKSQNMSENLPNLIITPKRIKPTNICAGIKDTKELSNGNILLTVPSSSDFNKFKNEIID